MKINYFVVFDGCCLMYICNNQEKHAGMVEEGQERRNDLGTECRGCYHIILMAKRWKGGRIIKKPYVNRNCFFLGQSAKINKTLTHQP